MTRNKLLDIINFVLFVILLVLVIRLIKPFGLNTISPSVSSPEPSTWGRNRDFPPDFTQEERILLTEQFHDYERITPEMDAAYERYLDLFKTERSTTSEITVIKYKDDCFVRPVILSLKSGQKITVKNNSSSTADLGMGSQHWKVSPNDTTDIYPKLEKEQDNQLYWGYSCADKGLAGYFVSRD